MNIQATAVK